MRHTYILILIFAISNFTSYTAAAQGWVPDTQLHVTMKPISIIAKRKWANDTIRYKYNQMKYYVTTVLPYVHEAVDLYNDLEAKTNTEGIGRKERKKYVQKREDELREKFDAEVKALNETQGVLMVKLIARQTGVNIFDILLEYKNRLAATKWQGWARLHGFNLNRRYNPDDNIMLENIMEELGYPLPYFYEEREILTAN